MRIISGKYKNRIISPPSNFSARPTTDMAKESLFNILNNYCDFESSQVLDLFSGTGSIAYEFASRGCLSVFCIENNYSHAQFIQKMSKDVFHEITCIKADVFSFISKTAYTFDIIFADPPYDLQKLETLPELIKNANILKPDGIFIMEHSSKYSFTEQKGFYEMRKYGKVHFSFFKHEI